MNFRTIDERPFAVSRSGVPRLLLGFVTLSLLIHTLLIIPGNDAEPLSISQLGTPYIRAVLSHEPTATDSTEQIESTEIQTNNPPVAQTRETPTHNSIQTPEPRGQPTEVRETSTPSPAATETRERVSMNKVTTETPAEPPSKLADNESPDTTHQATPAAEKHTQKSAGSERQIDAAQHNYLLGQLQNQLSRYLTYPLRARRRGWEGEVLLGLRLDSEGQLHDIHLLHSSGYALLDRSALKALARIERLQLPANAPPLQPTHLQLPVIYRLSKS